MPAITQSAPGKIILAGEHAVVYGQPAIAIPVQQVSAKVTLIAEPTAPPNQVTIEAPEIHLHADLRDLPEDHPLRETVRLTLAAHDIAALPALRILIHSTIPVAAGLGSGASVSVALTRAISAFLGHPLDDSVVNQIAYQIDCIHHGTPSGVDNTVITYARPVWFVRGREMDLLPTPYPFTVVIGYTGVASKTSDVVLDLRERWKQDPQRYESQFEAIGSLVRLIRHSLSIGDFEGMGKHMDENHRLLQAIDVSSPELDRLVAASRAAGALGAKLCGGGRGGNMIALCQPLEAERISQALLAAGAPRVITTLVGD